MALIRYVEANGNTIEVDAPVGTTLMQAAVDHLVEGITADCGGGCACGTCHCYIKAQTERAIPAPDAFESGLLASLGDTRPESRLACQITVTEAMDGLCVQIP
jgi:2Fe-2S ferredoxin